MRTKLREGLIIRSDKFVNGYPGENEIQATDKFVVVHVEEHMPETTIGNRTSSYHNEMHAKMLKADGSYNESGKLIKFSTTSVQNPLYNSLIPETEIEILGEMKKTYVLDVLVPAKTPSKWVDYDKKIADLEAQICAIKSEKAAFESMSEEHQLALRLHTDRCICNHEDQCGWYYEINKGEHDWKRSAHDFWLKKASSLIERAKEVGVTVEVALKILDAGK